MISVSSETDIEFKQKLPWGTALLILLQLLFFFTVQLDNNRYRQTAIDYYFDSHLYQTEFPLYIRYLQKYMANDVFYQRLENISSGSMSNIEMYWLIHYDPFFQNILDTKAMPENTLYYVNWEQKRNAYKQLIKKDIVQTYSFKSINPEFLGVIVSLFSTENYIQFIVNILFLVILGLLLEATIGIRWLMVGYFVGGLLMISFYCLVAPISLIPISANSGAIMSLLGLLTVLYGAKKEKIYYYNGKNISSVYVACFIFLPFWMVIQYALYSERMISAINIYTQLAPLLGGMLIGLYLRKTVGKNISIEDEIPGTDDLKERFELAAKEIADLHYESAKTILYQLLDEYPNNKDVCLAIFNIVKTKPSSKEYHEIVNKIFSINEMSNTTTAMINLVFNDYIKKALPSIQLDTTVYLSLLQRFRKSGYFEDANKILNVLNQSNQEGKLSETLAKEQLLLARSYSMKGNATEADGLIKTLMSRYPETEAAKQVESMLEDKKNPLS